MKWLDQLFCVHWFDPVKVRTYNEPYGAIVCTEQKSDDVTYEERACWKCGLTERREIRRKYRGWS